MSEIVAGNPINDAHKGRSFSHSTFDLSRNMYLTPTFGKYFPIMALEVVPDDGPIKFRNKITTRSLTLSEPLMQDISLKKDFFEVPMESILPMNWDKVYINPVKGDDVDAEKVNCVVPNLHLMAYELFKREFDYVVSYIRTEGSFDTTMFLTLCRAFIFGEKFFSSGSLLSYLGVSYSNFLRITFGDETSFLDFDSLFDRFSSQVMRLVSNNSFFVVDSTDDYRFEVKDLISWRYFLDRLRSNPFGLRIEDSYTFYDEDLIVFLYNVSIISPSSLYASSQVVNLSRVYAYQIACAHFYTNDKIDYIFSAELYREHIYTLIRRCIDDGGFYFIETFNYNGLACQYDRLSGYYLQTIFQAVIDEALDMSFLLPLVENIFGFNESLRFKDYFTGAKSQPLAVGDVNVAVADSKVSVIDVTRNTAVQKFLNSVNRIGMRFDEYIRGIFGVDKVERDYHNPAFLAHTNDIVFTAEVENTGDAQFSKPNSITSVLRGSSENYEFTYYADRPAVLIGIEYFDIRRAYMYSQDKLTTHVDRFDMFLPDLQFIGDQPVMLTELNTRFAGSTFGYQLRNMEYKQAYDIAVGGFVSGSLPGWLFTYDPVRVESDSTISPYFIRSHSTELDKFYLALTGSSLGTYFHFIQKSEMFIEARRPMVYAPEIL